MIRVGISAMLLCAWCAAQSIPSEVKAFVPNLTPLTRQAPVYPEALRQQGLQGNIEVLLTIDPGGVVTAAEALTGPAELRAAAMDAARQWTFHPVIRDGAAVCAMTTTIVAFYLPKGGPITPFNAAEGMAAGQRIYALTKAFPRSFWKRGGKNLDDWTAMLKGGGMPDFKANLVY